MSSLFVLFKSLLLNRSKKLLNLEKEVVFGVIVFNKIYTTMFQSFVITVYFSFNNNAVLPSTGKRDIL